MRYAPLTDWEQARTDRSVVKGDVRLLTETQLRVHLLDCGGLRPKEISERTGLSIGRISNIKLRLRQLGFETLKFRRTKHELREYRAAQQAIASQHGNVSDIGRSEHEPDDDEQPDADEPAFTDIKRCQCGLILPCYHGSNDAISLTGSTAGTAADAGPFRDDSEWRADAGKRRANSRRKAPKLTRANTERLRATQVRTGLGT